MSGVDNDVIYGMNSKMARTDDIDDVVSSVRDFVSYRDRHKSASRILRDKLLLTQEQRVTEVAPSSVEVDNVHTLETAKQDDRAGLEATIAELEAAVTAQSDDWEPDEGDSDIHPPRGDMSARLRSSWKKFFSFFDADSPGYTALLTACPAYPDLL